MQRNETALTLRKWLGRWFYFSLWRFRIGRFGIGWRSAGWSKWSGRASRFYFQRDPVIVLRAWGFWVQWGRS